MKSLLEWLDLKGLTLQVLVRELLHSATGGVKWNNHFGKQSGSFLKKLNVFLHCKFARASITRYHKLRVLSNKIYCLPALEDGSLRSRCQQAWFPGGAARKPRARPLPNLWVGCWQFLVSPGLAVSAFFFTWLSLFCVFSSGSYKNACHWIWNPPG